MQRPDPKKRAEIVAAAARLFASRGFHAVTLDAVAAQARVGKGTIYVYFASKEALYFGLLREGIDRMLVHIADRTRSAPPATPSLRLIDGIVGELVAMAFRFPDIFELMRAGLPRAEDRALRAKRRRLSAVLQAVIRRGIRRGELVDPRPDLTTQFLLQSIQAALLHGPRNLTARTLARHIVRVFGRALTRSAGPVGPARRRATTPV